MSKCLVIGSTVCDVMIYVNQLPQRQGDVHIKKQVFSLGGCAFNVVNVLHHMKVSYDFISPVGSGLYGEFVARQLAGLDIETPIRLSGANGCCYCFVEEDGERTFLSDHGVEYSFDKVWLEELDLTSYDYVYVCGLEVEEATGEDLVESLENIPAQLIFAPGPRGVLIPINRLRRLLALSPILHLNEAEAIAMAREDNVEEAVLKLYRRTGKPVIVTRGEAGVVAYDGSWHILPTYPNRVVDTIGAGDSHAGAVIAALSEGYRLETALDFANQFASRVIGTAGVHLTSQDYQELREKLQS